MNQRNILRLVKPILRGRGRRGRRGRESVWSILAVLVILAIGFRQQRLPPTKGKVTDVLDGDSLVIYRDGARQEVRLFAIDCPEKGMPHGQNARAYTRKLALRKTVSLRVVEEDRYGRLVGEVFLDDGRSLNQTLVEAGWAWWYRDYARDSLTLPRLEKSAREARLGLWADANPEPPWEFRRRMRGTEAP